MPKKYFNNHKVFWKAAENAQWLLDHALKSYDDNPLKSEVVYDRRNLSDLMALLVDVSDIPENQKEEYFKAEAKKIFQAFDTPSKDDPKKSDPELIKPYIKKMFDKVETDLDKVNYNDVKQLTNLFITMRCVQMLGTMVENFPQEVSELYPSPEEKAKIDAISERAYMTFMEGRVRISEQGLDDVAEYVNFIPGVIKDHSYFVNAEINNMLADAKTNNSDAIMLDPTSREIMTNYFYGSDFTYTNAAGMQGMISEFPYTQDNCIKDIVTALTTSHSNTAMEHVLMTHLISDESYPETISDKELLLIDGKSIKQITDELQANGMSENEAELEAGKILRNALVDGISKVSHLTTTIEMNGEMTITARDIKVDLDKLNEYARVKEHNWFRRVLHAFGWKIPPKYPDNKWRDANLLAKAANPSSNHNKGVEAMRQRILEKFNSLKRPFTSKRNVVDLIPKATLVETKLPQLDYSVEKSDFVANGPEEVMSFRREQVNVATQTVADVSKQEKAPVEVVVEVPKQEEAPVVEAPKQENASADSVKEEEKAPKMIEKSPNQLKAEQRAADPKVEASFIASFNSVTAKSNMKPIFKNVVFKQLYKDAAENIEAMWNAANEQSPAERQGQMANEAKEFFLRTYTRLQGLGLQTADRFAAAQKMTDMMINRFSPVAFDKSLEAFGDGYFLKHSDVDVIRSLEGIEDYGTARSILVDALKDIKSARESMDLFDEFDAKEDDEIKSPKVEDRMARSKDKARE